MAMESFNTYDLQNCKCVLIDEEGKKLNLRIRDAEMSSEFGGPLEVKIRCQYLWKDNVDEDCITQKDPTPETSTTKKDKRLKVRKVIFNPPATIVLWEDGTKTVVKCDERDKYNASHGLALCFMKKALGNTSRALNDVLHKELTVG